MCVYMYNLVSNNALLIYLYKMCPTIILIRLINFYVYRLDSKDIILHVIQLNQKNI